MRHIADQCTRCDAGLHALDLAVLEDWHLNDCSIRTRELTIDLQPNVLYVIGAKFDPDQRTDLKNYWAPIVLRDEGHACSLD